MTRFSGGFVKIWRSLFNTHYDGYDMAILSWIFANANYVDGKTPVITPNGRLIIRRGQLVTSIREIEDVTKFSKNLILRRLKLYAEEGIIGTLKTTRGTIITILNYDKYQCSENSHNEKWDTWEDTSRDTSEDAARDTSEDTSGDIIKELKKGKNEKKERNIYPPLSETWLDLGRQWLKMATSDLPWLAKNKKWTDESFGRELEKVGKAIGSTEQEMLTLLERLSKDEFWRKNAASPFGLLKRSKNGLRKVDNLIANLRTRQEVEMAKPLDQAAVDPWVYEFISSPVGPDNLQNNMRQLSEAQDVDTDH